jgi:hypothetical protein
MVKVYWNFMLRKYIAYTDNPKYSELWGQGLNPKEAITSLKIRFNQKGVKLCTN